MCFSTKIKTPKVDTSSIKAIDPAPVTEEPKGVLFGGDSSNDDATTSDTSSEVPTSGRKGLKVKTDSSSSTDGTGTKSSSNDGYTTTTTTTKSKTTGGSKAAIRKAVFNSK